MVGSIRLDDLPDALSGTIIVGAGRIWTATEGTGNTWPASTRLRIEDHAGVEQALTPVIVGTLATWTLTVAEALALRGTKTSGSLHARITTGTGDALRPWAAGAISIVSAYVGKRGAQSLGTVIVGPQGETGPSAYAAAVTAGYAGTEGEWAAGLAADRMAAIAAADRAEAAENRARGMVTSSVRANHDPTADAEILTLSIPTGMLDPLDSLILLLPVEV